MADMPSAFRRSLSGGMPRNFLHGMTCIHDNEGYIMS